MKPDMQPASELKPIINSATARFTVVLFLAFFTLGVALLIWKGLSAVPEGTHWIDPVIGALRTYTTLAAMLLVPYLVFAARVYSRRAEEQSELLYRQGLEEGRRQAAERFPQDAREVWRDWSGWKQLAEAARLEGRPEPEPPPRPGSPGP